MTKTITLKRTNPLYASAIAFPSHSTNTQFPISSHNHSLSMSTAQEQEQEDFSFPVSSSSTFIESPRLHWRRVPPTAKSSPLTRLELLRIKYQRRSFSHMENDSARMMTMMLRTNGRDHDQIDMDEGHDFNKMDLLWEHLHELHKSKNHFVEDDDSSDLEKMDIDKRRDLSLPVRRPHGTVAIMKVLKKLFYVKKTGSSRSI